MFLYDTFLGRNMSDGFNTKNIKSNFLTELSQCTKSALLLTTVCRY